MKLREAIRLLERRKRLILAFLAETEANNVQAIVDLAKEESSGPYTLAQLAKMGHPYAKRFKGGILPAGVINAQSGAFRANWKGKAGRFVSGRMVSHITNKSKVAAYLKNGTNRMIARLIDEEVMKKFAPIRRKLLKEALRRALKG